MLLVALADRRKSRHDIHISFFKIIADREDIFWLKFKLYFLWETPNQLLLGPVSLRLYNDNQNRECQIYE